MEMSDGSGEEGSSGSDGGKQQTRPLSGQPKDSGGGTIFQNPPVNPPGTGASLITNTNMGMPGMNPLLNPQSQIPAF